MFDIALFERARIYSAVAEIELLSFLRSSFHVLVSTQRFCARALASRPRLPPFVGPFRVIVRILRF